MPESRIVCVQILVPAVLGGDDWAATSVLGQDVRLLGVDLWLFPVAQNAFFNGLLRVMTGTTRDVSMEIVSLQWDTVFDMSMLLNQAFLIYSDGVQLSWTMNKVYSGAGRRFGISAENIAVVSWMCIASFKIAEGR